MANIPPRVYERNNDGFAVPDAGGTLAYKSVAFTFETTTGSIYLAPNGVLVDCYLSMSTVFDGSAPTVVVALDGTNINTFDPGNAMSRDASGLLPAAGQRVTFTVTPDASNEGVGQLVVIWAAI